MQEAVVLLHLPPTLDLGPRELRRIGRVDVGDPGHVDQDHARVRRPVPRALHPRQPVAAVLDGLPHQRPQLRLGHRRRALDVHVGELEQRRQRLDALRRGARVVVPGPGHRAHVGVAGRVDERRASTQRSPPLFHSRTARSRRSVVEPHARRPGVQQQLDARVLGQPLPDDLERLGVVRHPGARAVRVRALERDAVGGQAARDLPAEPADDPARVRARRVEGVERVEDRGRRPAHERQAVEQQRPRPVARRRDRRGRPGRAGPDDDDVEPVAHAAAPAPGIAYSARRVRDEDPVDGLVAEPASAGAARTPSSGSAGPGRRSYARR